MLFLLGIFLYSHSSLQPYNFFFLEWWLMSYLRPDIYVNGCFLLKVSLITLSSTILSRMVFHTALNLYLQHMNVTERCLRSSSSFWRRKKSSICFYHFICLLNTTNLVNYCNKLTSRYFTWEYIGKFFGICIMKPFSPSLFCWFTDITSDLTAKFPEKNIKFFWLKQ